MPVPVRSQPLESLQEILLPGLGFGFVFGDNILIFHGLLPHFILLVSWFLMVQPGILLILVALSLKLLPQQPQLPLLC